MKLNKICALLFSAVFAGSSLFCDSFTDYSVAITAYAENSALTITETELNTAGIKWQDCKKLTIYTRITKGGVDSQLSASAQLGENGKSSTKYLSGRNIMVGNAIQDNLIGKAGTGIYAFPDLSLNHKTEDGGEWQESYADKITITIDSTTDNTDFKVLGIRFDNGAVFAVEDGFSPDNIITESMGFDIIEKTARDLLKMTIDYCDTLDSSKYLPDSWNELQSALATARAVLEQEGAEDCIYLDARNVLERVKSNMRFTDTDTPENPLPFRELSNEELIFQMGVGINLGNTLDGHSHLSPSETSWQSVVTTKAYIQALHDAGFNTVRIPVTWGNTIDRDTYKIREDWLDRVQQIVDYCISQDMYAIINIHHDGAEQSGWLRVAAEDIDAVYEKFEYTWRNIAERFKDYDEHLIFESMNEITCMKDDMKNSQEAVDYDTPIIVNLNQIFVNVVRSTGSNNEKRWLAAVAHYANSGNHKDFVLPLDTSENAHIMFAAHIYKANTNTTWTYDEVYQVVNGLKMMSDKFDVPMYLGEYGNRTKEQDGTATGYNDSARAYFSEIVHRACQTAGVVPVVWDQGYSDNKYQTGLFTYWDREQCVPLFKSITDAMLRGTYLPNSELNNNWDYTDVTESPEIIPITKLETSFENGLELTVGQVMEAYHFTEPLINTNDVVLWSTDDDTVATVSRGRIKAKGIGTTTIRAYTQNSDLESTIKVTVYATEGEPKADSVIAPDEVFIETGKSQLLNAMLPDGTDGFLTYESSNPNVVTVSPTGRMFALTGGVAYITATANSGVSAVIRIISTEDGNAPVLSDTTISHNGKQALTINGTGKSKNLSVKTDTAGAIVAFASEDSSIVAVNSSLAFVADENGNVSIGITAFSEGTTTITAFTENGESVSFDVTVTDKPFPIITVIAIIAVTTIVAFVVIILLRKKQKETK